MHYIGITTQRLVERFRQHKDRVKRNSKSLIHIAMREYGVDNFEIEAIESGIPSELAEYKESYYIKQFNSFYRDGNGYNMTSGGFGIPNYQFSDDVRKHLSAVNKGRKFSAERNERIRIAMTGRYYKPEWKAALSKARMGRFTGEDNSFYGKQHTEHTKQLIRKNNSGYIVLQLDDNGAVLREFYNAVDAGKWVAENVSSAAPNTCTGRIRVVCGSKNPDCKAYGFRWRYKERSID